MVNSPFTHTVLGRTGLPVCRLGMASSYGVPVAAVEEAIERGVNYLYWGSIRRSGFGQAIRNRLAERERMVLVIQSYSRFVPLLRMSLERALHALGTDYADVLLLGYWSKPVPERLLDAARELQARGLARHLAVSGHHRPAIPGMFAAPGLDVFHVRYNAAHPGAERDIFPHLPADPAHRPGMVAFTATSHGELLRKSHVPRHERVPTATDCYRFVLSNPAVDICMTGPANAEEARVALEALERGPLSDEEMAWMRRVGQAVR